MIEKEREEIRVDLPPLAETESDRRKKEAPAKAPNDFFFFLPSPFLQDHESGLATVFLFPPLHLATCIKKTVVRHTVFPSFRTSVNSGWMEVEASLSDPS